jgi:DNA repair protein RecO (recombination protein O)
VKKRIKTEGICLRRLNYSDTSQVATFLTPDRGRVPCIAKGIWRAPKKGIVSGIDLVTCYRLTLYESRTGALKHLTEHTVIEPFRGLRRAIEPALCAVYAAELMQNFTAEGEDCRRIYAALKTALSAFSTLTGLGKAVLTLEVEALHHYGACPTFDRCCSCNRKINDGKTVLFSAEHGGPLCLKCRGKEHSLTRTNTIPVRGRRLHVLASIAGGQGWEQLENNPMEIVALSRLLRFHMRYLTGKELTMWKYLQGRHMSNYLRRVRHTS